MEPGKPVTAPTKHIAALIAGVKGAVCKTAAIRVPA